MRLSLYGDVDRDSAGAVADRVRECLRHRPRNLVVDLSALSFLDAAGVRTFLEGRRRAGERHIPFRVVGARGIVQRVLEITGVSGLLHPSVRGLRQF